MKKLIFGMLAGIGFLAFVGWNTLPNDDTSIPGPTIFGKQVYVSQSQLYIGGTAVTANAANLNSGLASSTASLVSNVNLKVYASNIVLVAGATITLPSNASISNDTLSVYGKGGYAVGGGASNRMIQVGTFTNGQPTVTFQTAFANGTKPVITANWTDSLTPVTASTNTSIAITTIASNGFTATTLATLTCVTNANYIAIGVAP